jgi:hypothetical protein
MTDAPKPEKSKPKGSIGQSIGGVLFGFEQQVFRNMPPPHELVHKARPDAPVPAGDGSFVTFELPGGEAGASLGAVTLDAAARRPLPPGFPEDRPRPPVVAESGDPFGTLRVLDGLARMQRGAPVRVDDLVDRLNAASLDWLFTRRVVVDALVALQANWMSDYRNASGIVLEDGPRGPQVTLEDSTRVDPWLVGQAERALHACREALDAFARRDDPFAAG